MEHFVVDTNILVASFNGSDSLHSKSQPYIEGLKSGSYIFHLPMLVIAELIGTMSRIPTANRLALLARTNQSLREWERSGKISLYPLDQGRLELSLTISQRDRLKGADSVVAALSEELGMPLKTFDEEIISRFSQASS